ncbi:hypothetical protein IDJ81_09965 [Tsuneonella flava]|uniref:DUF4139 domain-containing protein n=1 Tax=Tsuneonella flava TaxID=2055955 RepID=A0ABX7K8V1_9SPHN|nr:hypothetical protein [Tsuneonella flava]QSB43694.1 hypothetical protein IDJ81_09965 [Tsuneonella flava]
MRRDTEGAERVAMRFLIPSALAMALAASPVVAQAPRPAVDASTPQHLAVTVYRDPQRGADQAMNRNWPRGFAMVSETRTVTLPPGESTVRFDGVAEGMVAVSAIVTGLPGGTIEKNRNADLLSPAALVDGTLGNRVTITRTNPATGKEVSQDAVVRTRADGGLVLQTASGYEAVRCSGLPEKLAFDKVPTGLSPNPVFSIDTRSPQGGTYTVTLTYLAWGFDWQAHYVATLRDNAAGGKATLALTSWLTLLNDNGQSFPDAELMAVAGTLSVKSDYRQLADPPRGKPLQLMCYPLGSTAEGTPVDYLAPPPPPPPPPAPMAMAADAIMVTGMRRAKAELASGAAMVAQQEELGDLKLYRVPEPVTVAAKGMKQIAFLQRDSVKADVIYRGDCTPDDATGDSVPLEMRVEADNEEKNGLGVPMPMGGITVFEPTGEGTLLLGEDSLRDYAKGEEVAFSLGESGQIRMQCAVSKSKVGNKGETSQMLAVFTNANRDAVKVRLDLGGAGEWTVKRGTKARVKNGRQIYEFTVPGGGQVERKWTVRARN